MPAGQALARPFDAWSFRQPFCRLGDSPDQHSPCIHDGDVAYYVRQIFRHCGGFRQVARLGSHMAKGFTPKMTEPGWGKQMATMEANAEKSSAFDREEVAAQLMGFLERDDDCDAGGTVSSMFRYAVENGAVTITGTRDGLVGAVSITDMINGLPVTVMGEFSFANCPGLKSVTIPRGATIAVKGAFDDEVTRRSDHKAKIMAWSSCKQRDLLTF